MSDNSQNAGPAPAEPTTVEPTPTGPWLATKFGPAEVGRLPWLYLFMGVILAVILLLLLALDVGMVAMGLGLGDDLAFVSGLNVNNDLIGVAAVAGIAIVMTFIGVLWPIGILSQMLLCFALFARARKAPMGAALAETALGGLGGIEVLVQTPYTLRCTNVGNMGWRPNWQLLVGGYGIALALTIASAFDRWKFNGADKASMIVAMLLPIAGGIVFLVLGIRSRLAKLAREAAAAGAEERHRTESAKRSARRQELRRAKLAPEERAAEDAKLAEFLAATMTRHPNEPAHVVGGDERTSTPT